VWAVRRAVPEAEVSGDGVDTAEVGSAAVPVGPRQGRGEDLRVGAVLSSVARAGAGGISRSSSRPS